MVMTWDGARFNNMTYSGGLVGVNPYPLMNSVGAPLLALDNSGTPMLGFVEGTPDNSSNFFVYRGYSGGFMRLGGGPADVTKGLALAVDTLNRPVALYHDTKLHPDAYVIRWDGSAWQPLGADPVLVGLTNPLVIDSHGRAVTAGNGVSIVLRANQ
jgi:hypothetical protein